MSTGVYQLNQQVRSTSNNVSATSFVMIPGMLIEDKWLHKKMNLSLRAIKVLLKLYEYNNLVEFGGVNPAKLTKDSAYTVQICPMLYHDIGLSEAEFRSSFDRLINVGLVREVDAIMSVYLLNLGVEYRFQCEDYWFTKSGYSLQANSKALKIYRPTYQYSDDISGWLDSMVQRGLMWMQSANTLTTRSVQLQLLSPLQRGSTKQTIKAMRNPEEVHYANQIRRAATQMMDSNNLSAITYPLSISIRVYHDSAPDDPLLIIKLVMDALQGVCYINDMQVQSVHYELCVASRKDYHIEINCGSLPLIAVQGTARGRGILYTARLI